MDKAYMDKINNLVQTVCALSSNSEQSSTNILQKQLITKFRLEIAETIYEEFDQINSIEHFNLYYDLLFKRLEERNISYSSQKIKRKTNFRILELIYNRNTSYLNWDVKEEQVRKLIYFTKDYNFELLWKKNITRSVKNLIFGNIGRLGIRVKSLRDLKRVIESWQSIGIGIYWTDLANEIDHEIKKRKQLNKEIPKIRKIIGPLQKFVESLEALETNHGELVVHNFSQLNYDLNRRKVRKRAIVDGKHLRDFQMTRYFKAIRNYQCEIDNEQCYGQVTVNHKIPLALGVDLGGIDHPVNYEVLCEVHHDEIEMDLLIKLHSLPTYEEKYDYLQKRFPDVYVQTHRILPLKR